MRCCFFQWKCVVILSSEIILLGDRGDGMVFAHWELEACRTNVVFVVRMFCRIFLHVPKHIYSCCLWSSRLLVRSYVKCNVLYSVVYNCSNGVSNNGSSLRIKPFRLLKENSVHVYQQSKYCWSSLKRHELKLTVFAFVFYIYAVMIYRGMKVRSIIFLR